MPISSRFPLDPPMMAKRHILCSFRAPVSSNMTLYLYASCCGNKEWGESGDYGMGDPQAHPVLSNILRSTSHCQIFIYSGGQQMYVIEKYTYGWFMSQWV